MPTLLKKKFFFCSCTLGFLEEDYIWFFFFNTISKDPLFGSSIESSGIP